MSSSPDAPSLPAPSSNSHRSSSLVSCRSPTMSSVSSSPVLAWSGVVSSRPSSSASSILTMGSRRFGFGIEGQGIGDGLLRTRCPDCTHAPGSLAPRDRLLWRATARRRIQRSTVQSINAPRPTRPIVNPNKASLVTAAHACGCCAVAEAAPNAPAAMFCMNPECTTLLRSWPNA